MRGEGGGGGAGGGRGTLSLKLYFCVYVVLEKKKLGS